MKSVILFTYLSLIPLFCLAQIEKELWRWEAIDSTQIVALYEYTWVQYKDKKFKEDLLLEIGKGLSKTYSYRSWQYDSIRSTPEGIENNKKFIGKLFDSTKGKTKEEARNILDNIPCYGTQTVVYKNFPKGSILVQDGDASKYYFRKYEEEMEPQEWELREDTLTVLEYLCRKAICTWRGRNYVAWYAEDIPVGEGPLKFFGLPGLIMKLEDTEQMHSFNIKGLERIQKTIYLNKPCGGCAGMEYEPIERKELLKRMWKEKINQMRMFNRMNMSAGLAPTFEEKEAVKPLETDFE